MRHLPPGNTALGPPGTFGWWNSWSFGESKEKRNDLDHERVSAFLDEHRKLIQSYQHNSRA